MASGNWADNPYNHESSFKQHALPGLLFEECHRNCVDFNLGAPNEQEAKCIKNCQAKTY